MVAAAGAGDGGVVGVYEKSGAEGGAGGGIAAAEGGEGTGERGGGVLAGEVGVGEGGRMTALCLRCASQRALHCSIEKPTRRAT